MIMEVKQELIDRCTESEDEFNQMVGKMLQAVKDD